MYKDIPNIEPLNDDIIIWRYMDLASFMSIILQKQLMFRRASNFKDCYDTFVDLDDESKKNLINALKEGEKQPNSFYKVSTQNDEVQNDTSMSIKSIQPIFRNNEICIHLDEKGQHIGLADITYCSSWSENDHENYALWKIYLGNKPEGVAIKTSIKKIREVLNKNSIYDFYIGRVKYDNSSKVNFFKDKMSNHDIILRKRKEYEYEKEIRIYTIIETIRNVGPYLYLSIENISDLIEEVYVSPFVKDWLSNIIISFLKKNNLYIKVNGSSIKER